VKVVPGEVAEIQFARDDNQLASGSLETTVTAILKDAAGNAVADGTVVTWSLEGLAAYSASNADEDGRSVVHDGEVRIKIPNDGSWKSVTVRASSDGFAAAETFQAAVPSATLTASRTEATLGTDQEVELRLLLLGPDGQPMPNQQVSWLVSKGKLASATSMTDGMGVATVRVGLQGGSEQLGNLRVAARAAVLHETTTIYEKKPAQGITIDIDHRLLAADATGDGTLPVPQRNGVAKQVAYYASTSGEIRGGDGLEQVRLFLVGEAAAYFRINGSSGYTDVTLGTGADDWGTAGFEIRSNGQLPPHLASRIGHLRIVAVPKSVAEANGGQIPNDWESTRDDWYRNAEFSMSATSAALSVRLTDTATKLGGQLWDLVDGVDELSDLGGDLTVSLLPFVGAWPDIRDLVVNVTRMMPGGESPDWVTLSFSVVGLATEIFPPADWAVDVLKHSARIGTELAPHSVTLIAVVTILVKKVTGSGQADEFADLLKRFATDAPYERFVDDLVEGQLEIFTQFNTFAKKLGDLDAARNAIESIARISGKGAAQESLQVLSRVNPDALKNLTRNRKWDVIGKAARNPGELSSFGVKHYANTVQHLASKSPEIHRAVQRFEDLSGVPGLWTRLKTARGFKDGFLGELAVAMMNAGPLKFVGQGVRGVPKLSDIDVVTAAAFIEVKDGWSVFRDFATSRSSTTALAEYSRRIGKTPVLAIPEQLSRDLTDSQLETFTRILADLQERGIQIQYFAL